MPGIRVEKEAASMVISRFMRRAPSVKRSIWKPSMPPPSFGKACGAKVPSTPVLSGGCLSCESAGDAQSRMAVPIAAKWRMNMSAPLRISPARTLDQALLNSNLEAILRHMSPSAERILVINPNSTQAVTDGIDRAMEPLRMAGGPTIECVTLKEGPPGIATQAHVESVVAPISATVKSRDTDCSAFVIASYSDPGLHAAREGTTKPALGIAECGILTARTLAQRFGVISIIMN